MKDPFVTPNVLKDPFIAPHATKDPLVTPNVLKDPFITSGAGRGKWPSASRPGSLRGRAWPGGRCSA
jgi:hypothetical protein